MNFTKEDLKEAFEFQKGWYGCMGFDEWYNKHFSKRPILFDTNPGAVRLGNIINGGEFSKCGCKKSKTTSGVFCDGMCMW